MIGYSAQKDKKWHRSVTKDKTKKCREINGPLSKISVTLLASTGSSITMSN